MSATEPAQISRWILALGLAAAVAFLHWHVARPDVIAVLGASDPLTWLTTSTVPAILAFLLSFVLLGAVPALAVGVLLELRPGDVGLGPGDRRAGARLLAVGIPLALLAGVIGAQSHALSTAYPLSPALTRAPLSFAPYVLAYGLYYAGFEFLFRGYLLFGATRRFGPLSANLLQSLLATAIHIGKPDIELVAALPASLLFGWVALRTKSIWYAVLIHWLVGVSLDWNILAGGS